MGHSMPVVTFKDNPATKEFEERAKNILKAELKRKGITYAELAMKLADIGVTETERNIANKISRGGFTAAFLIQCLTVAQCDTISVKL